MLHNSWNFCHVFTGWLPPADSCILQSLLPSLIFMLFWNLWASLCRLPAATWSQFIIGSHDLAFIKTLCQAFHSFKYVSLRPRFRVTVLLLLVWDLFMPLFLSVPSFCGNISISRGCEPFMVNQCPSAKPIRCDLCSFSVELARHIFWLEKHDSMGLVCQTSSPALKAAKQLVKALNPPGPGFDLVCSCLLFVSS